MTLPAWTSPTANPLSAAARADIGELLARYAWCLDTDHPDAVAALFTDDGVFDGVSGLFEGRERVREMAAVSRSHDDGAWVQHWVANLVFDAAPGVRGEHDGDRVTVRSMCIGPSLQQGQVGNAFVGSYVDVCVRQDGRWLFARRRWRPWDGHLVA